MRHILKKHVWHGLLVSLLYFFTLNSATAAPLKYLALGDSYTIGESVTEEQRWPELLIHELKRLGIRSERPKIIAKTGWITRQLLNKIDLSAYQRYDIVTLMIGVNDQFQNRSLPQFTRDFKKLLKTALAATNGNAQQVYVISIPDWSVSIFGRGHSATVSPEIAAFNVEAEKLSTAAGTQWVDISRLVEMARTDNSLLAHDKLHFSGKMHQRWAQLIASRIAQNVTKPE